MSVFDIGFGITGDKEVDRLLRQLKECYTKKVLLKAYRQAAKPLIKAVRSKIEDSGRSDQNLGKGRGSRKSGDLRKSIGNIRSKSKTYSKIYVGPRAKGVNKYRGYIGHWVELGDEYSGVNFKGRKYMRDGYQAGKAQAQQRLKGDMIKAIKSALK
jgi:hypothetical protein